MGANSTIEWTEATWNPTTGCTKISAGCKYCYAESMTRRFERYWGSFDKIRFHPDRLEIPLKRRKPTVYFVNSMSDLFHQNVHSKFIHQVFTVMNNSPQHTFQVLTKRAERLASLSSSLNWTKNIWMGVSVENRQAYDRIGYLRQSGAHIKFLSVEPLLNSVHDIDIHGIDWVIVGGESGRKPRPMEEKWVLEVKERCRQHKVPFFFKQWGGVNKKKSGRTLRGRTYNAMPRLFC